MYFVITANLARQTERLDSTINVAGKSFQHFPVYNWADQCYYSLSGDAIRQVNI